MKAMFSKVSCLVIVAMILAQFVSGAAPDSWHEGQEAEITGHSFGEEYWTAEITNTTDDGAKVSFSMFYVNMGGAEAFMLALNNATKNNETGLIPYQLFGMHFRNANHKECFLAAVFAFLMAYNDTNGNGIQDPGNESVYYVVPFGASNTSVNVSWEPETEVHPVTKLGDNHYTFGMTYRNLYAKVIDGNSALGFLLTLALPLYTVRFSELSITYDIEIDEDTGEIEVETFYTIGQVEVLYVFGYDATDGDWVREMNVTDVITPDWGISAVHYLNIFASNYQLYTDDPDNTVTPNQNTPAPESLNINIGDEKRAFQINYRGTYDLIDEDSDTTVESGLDAINILVGARLPDHLFVLWQLGFSAAMLSTIAYALSPTIQGDYSSPLDLQQNSLNPLSQRGFRRAAFWYAVSFPNWNGYRVEHDPVYTAYTDVGQGEEDDDLTGLLGLGALLGGMLCLGLILIVIVVIIAIAVSRRRKAQPIPPPYQPEPYQPYGPNQPPQPPQPPY